MQENNTKKPPLKLKLNLDYKVIFENQPGAGKEYTSEEYGTKSYLYFLEVWDKRLGAFTKERWYASEKQQRVLEESDLKSGEEYFIVKEEIEGSKAQNFWVYDKDMNKLNGRGKNMKANVDRVTQAMTSDDLPPLEDYLKDPEATQSVSLQNTTPVNANKTQATKQAHNDAQNIAWAIKYAVSACGQAPDSTYGLDHEHYEENVAFWARAFLKIHKKLMSE